MKQFFSKKSKLFSIIGNCLLYLLSIFLIFESLLPKNNPAFLFKGAYPDAPSVSPKSAPTLLDVSEDKINIKASETKRIKFKLTGKDDEFNKNIGYTVDDPNICNVYHMIPYEITVIGKSAGLTNVTVFSIANPELKDTFTVTVSGEKTFNTDYSKTLYGMNLNGGGNDWLNNTKVNVQDSINIYLLLRDEKNAFIPIETKYESDGEATVDEWGNVVFSETSFGKTVSVRAISGPVSCTFTFTILYPPSYKETISMKIVLNFVVYVFTFVLAGYVFYSLRERNLLNFKSNRTSFYVWLCVVGVFPFIPLFLQYFVLRRQFEFIYWIVSPLCVYLMAGLDSIISRFSKLFVFKNDIVKEDVKKNVGRKKKVKK